MGFGVMALQGIGIGNRAFGILGVRRRLTNYNGNWDRNEDHGDHDLTCRFSPT